MGGICGSIMIAATVTILVFLAIPIYEGKNPYNSSIETALGQDVEIFYHENAKIVLALTDIINNFEIDFSKINVRVRHKLYEYDE